MKLIRLFCGIVATALLFGCGGGGGGTPAVPTQAGTSVSLATAKAFQTGTAAAGSQLSFTLTGSDTQGGAWSGSFAIVSDGATTFEGQAVTKARSLTTLTRTSSGASVTGSTSSYFLVSDGSLYKTVDSFNVTGTPTSQTAVPDSAKVGDSGNLWNITYSDGSSSSSTWKLEPEFNGNTKLTSSTTTIEASNAVSSTEEQSIYLDANGNPFKFDEKVTVSGVTVSLTGNKQ